MLRDKAGSQHFNPFARDLFDNRRIIQKPPASEWQQVREFPGIDAEFVLILAAQNADQKAILREFGAEMLQCAEIRFSRGVARQPYGRVDLITGANHQRERNVEFAARWKDRFSQQLGPRTVLRKLEGVRQRTSHVDRLHVLEPIGQESPYFGYRLSG